MEKHLEDYLWNEICANTDKEQWHSDRHRFPRDVIKEMIDKGWIKSPKQAWSTLKKWIKSGKYDYGSCLDLGWKIENIDYKSKENA